MFYPKRSMPSARSARRSSWDLVLRSYPRAVPGVLLLLSLWLLIGSAAAPG